MPKVVNIQDIYPPHRLASEIANQYERWKNTRQAWEAEKQEIRNYLFATDTSKTSNATLPWKNTTTIPKLTQIRDNLHANYMAAIFPNDDWFKWEGGDEESTTKEKRDAIQAYMRNKLRISGFREEVQRLVLDYIDYGNAFAEVIYVHETHTDPEGNTVPVYIGPKLRRISPYDLVFDITASDFEKTPTIQRTILTLGELHKMVNENPEDAQWAQDAIDEAMEFRNEFGGLRKDDLRKAEGLEIDGFSSVTDYFTSPFVEVLTFEGDIYDVTTKTLYERHKIIVIDRSKVIYRAPFESWLGRSNKRHVGWRTRPDNLMAMGPLDNLVGMQYRADHLENLKADVFDQIAFPVVYQRGEVEDWEWGPGERIYGDTESDVQVLRPDATALNADFQIQRLHEQMEEMAGAPKQAAGIRTPGEKTAYEVQVLENGAGRIFQNKVQHFESVFLEPILNAMFEIARRNLDVADTVRVFDPDTGAEEFLTIQPEDIKAKGKLVPVGARHFAKIAQTVQNLTGFLGSAAYADPEVKAHVSGLKIAEVMQELLGLDRYELVRKDIRVAEAADTQRAVQAVSQDVGIEGSINSAVEGVTPEDVEALNNAG